jgi:hypothetical protein
MKRRILKCDPFWISGNRRRVWTRAAPGANLFCEWENDSHFATREGEAPPNPFSQSPETFDLHLD